MTLPEQPVNPVGERLVSIETKLDLVLKDHGDRLNDHETRLRAHTTQITEVQHVAEKAVSPKALWAGLAGAVTVAYTAVNVIDWVFKR